MPLFRPDEGGIIMKAEAKFQKLLRADAKTNGSQTSCARTYKTHSERLVQTLNFLYNFDCFSVNIFANYPCVTCGYSSLFCPTGMHTFVLKYK